MPQAWIPQLKALLETRSWGERSCIRWPWVQVKMWQQCSPGTEEAKNHIHTDIHKNFSCSHGILSGITEYRERFSSVIKNWNESGSYSKYLPLGLFSRRKILRLTLGNKWNDERKIKSIWCVTNLNFVHIIQYIYKKLSR